MSITEGAGRQPVRDVPGGASTGARHATLPALATGTRLLEYRIDGVLGSGRWGITYLATDARLHARVVIKEYLPQEIAFRSADGGVGPNASRHRERYERGLQAFLRQGRALAGLRHPALVRVVRFFEAQRSAYIVFEHVKGQPLKLWWLQHDGSGEAGLVALLRPLCDALAVVHAAGLLHRDLRPENVLVRDDGLPVLVDFGSPEVALAVALDAAAGAATGYAAPELATPGSVAAGPWTDLYALSATLYWCVAGRRPVDAATRQRDPRAHVRAIEAGRGRFGEPFLAAIDRGLALEPARRPHDILELRLALFDDHPLPARGDAALQARDTVIAGTDELAPGVPRARRVRRAWSLPVKTALLALAAALLPALAASGWLLASGGDALHAAQGARLEAAARGAAGRVGQWLADQRQFARQLAIDPDVVLFLARPDEAAQALLRDRVARLLAARPELDALAVLDLRGHGLLASDPALEGPAPAARADVRDALRGQARGPGPVGAPPVLAQPVAGDDGRPLGVLLVRLKPDARRALLAGPPPAALRDARDGRDTIAGQARVGDTLSAWAPVPGHDWVAGVDEALDTSFEDLRLPLAAALGVVAVLAGALGWRLGRRVAQPVGDLTRAAGAVAGGDFNNATVPVRHRDEVGELAQTFNVMVDVLRQRERERDRSG